MSAKFIVPELTTIRQSIAAQAIPTTDPWIQEFEGRLELLLEEARVWRQTAEILAATNSALEAEVEQLRNQLQDDSK